jgi:hypothetical protein
VIHVEVIFGSHECEAGIAQILSMRKKERKEEKKEKRKKIQEQ